MGSAAAGGVDVELVWCGGTVGLEAAAGDTGGGTAVYDGLYGLAELSARLSTTTLCDSDAAVGRVGNGSVQAVDLNRTCSTVSLAWRS